MTSASTLGTGTSGRSPSDSPPTAGVSFAVVIPMFNEEAGAEQCVRAVVPVLDALAQRSSLIAVNDGSQDDTRVILARLASEFGRLTIVEHPENRGYGAALATGAERADSDGFEYALFMDSDLTNDPADIPKFVAKMEEGVDVIKASRYSHGGSASGVPWFRWAISRVGNAVAAALFRLPLTDCTNGFRATKIKVLRDIRFTERSFAIIMEELFHEKRLASSFCHVPVSLTDRAAHLRGTSFRYRPGVFWDYLKYPLRSFVRRSILRRP